MPSITVVIDSDWAYLQLVTEGATLEKQSGIDYTGFTFSNTQTGVLFGEPNKDLVPQKKVVTLELRADSNTVTFVTGHGSHGTGGQADSGSITVTIANHQYINDHETGDGMNFKVFHDAPIFPSKR